MHTPIRSAFRILELLLELRLLLNLSELFTKLITKTKVHSP